MNQVLSIPELEARMRPGAFSWGGFLGANESLEAILAQDTQTLESRGVSHRQIADALERVLVTVIVQYDKDLRAKRSREQLHFSLCDPETIPHFALDSLPNVNSGYLAGDLQVFFVTWRGLQECPWGCGYSNLAYVDFFILNRRIGEYITGAGLVVHLIREHHFFEGVESPYRTDPLQAIRVLELLPFDPLRAKLYKFGDSKE